MAQGEYRRCECNINGIRVRHIRESITAGFSAQQLKDIIHDPSGCELSVNGFRWTIPKPDQRKSSAYYEKIWRSDLICQGAYVGSRFIARRVGGIVNHLLLVHTICYYTTCLPWCNTYWRLIWDSKFQILPCGNVPIMIGMAWMPLNYGLLSSASRLERL